MNRIDRPAPKLLFGTPEFLPEGTVQSTVRVGPKWRDDLKGTVEPRVPCYDLEGNYVGEATIVGTLFGSFKRFATLGSVVNHQENCREVEGLAGVLDECYPDFDPDASQVTILYFTFVPAATEEEESTDDSADEKEGE